MAGRLAGLISAPVATPLCWRPLPARVPAAPAAGLGRWLTLLCLTLLGYALAGKGWAYIGIPPIFIGETVLLCGVVCFFVRDHWSRILEVPAVWLLLLMAAWGFLRTASYFSEYGAEALRDAALWGYSAFALLVFGTIIAQPSRLAALVNAYGRLPKFFLIVVPVAWSLLRIYPRPIIPNWPWVEVPVIHIKGGDSMVHLAGILAFWVAGLGGRVRFFWVALLALGVILIGTYDRAGLLAFLTAFALCFVLKPRERSLWRLIAIGVCGLLLLAATEFRLQMPGRERVISFEQLTANLTSTLSSSHAGDLNDTKEWRLEWWQTIFEYTLGGKYCWTGKGFGISLADDDGFQVEEDSSLRNPHNGHLAMLARAGLPGFTLWVLVQLAWGWSVLGAYRRSRRLQQGRWPDLFLFLLAYWTAFIVNASFDVFLEGPMGGIWFWTVYGVGLAAVWLHRHDPQQSPVPLAA